MASSIPSALKTADITRFVLRANQLEKVKPAIAYWCTLLVVETILSKGLEKSDEECMLFTASLMDKLEQSKTENEADEAIHDDAAAQAYVEQFALETFERADKALRSRTATAHTAEVFQAARTFLDLLAIWQKPLNTEIAAKSKYAKYHALRILKAVKAKEDPNLPPEEEEPVELETGIDPNHPGAHLQPSVEDVPDHQQPSPFTQATASHPPTSSFSPMQQSGGDVSPLESEHANDGYFPSTSSQPQVPTFTADATSPDLATASAGPSAPSLPGQSPMDVSGLPTSPPVDAQNFYTQRAPYAAPSVWSQAPVETRSPATPQPSAPPSVIPYQQNIPAPSAPPQVPRQQAPPSNFHSGPENYKNDDEAVLQAQKHGKWALSALNFDDVETAVKEFRLALQSLGA
ncbi:DUF605-domain-containing protein [Microthyrium microscopicum]|uniref:DUF605-domain-containing protein n=1 Tax=Microthyrium microscopicum TaxID=703497 RepID=A0A6A6UT44_9PEZI|nr:DUF605-domain-containing protein [Microthyrium microscopicum]